MMHVEGMGRERVLVLAPPLSLYTRCQGMARVVLLFAEDACQHASTL